MSVILATLLIFSSFIFSISGNDDNPYAYQVQVNLTGNEYEYDGKMMMTFDGSGFSHQVVLSPEVEIIKEGVYMYTPFAPAPVEQMKSVSLDWKWKTFCIFCTIKVDEIVLTPAYIPDEGQRKNLTRKFCSDPRPTPVKSRKLVKFDKNC